MTSTFTPKSIQYDPKTVRRAAIAFAGTPFQWHLLESMRDQSVALPKIAGQQGVEANYTDRVLSELRVEYLMMWLIQVGMLRREVDGQGLTDSFRLTPLGRQILEEWQRNGDLGRISWAEYLSNNFRCWYSRFSL